jgi:7-cyano-7-deazaguanine reductase
VSGRFDELRGRMRSQAASPDEVDPGILEAVDYEYAGGRDLTVTIEQPEFTSVCPMTGLPDFGTVTVTYVPRLRIVELQSLKFYLLQYRQVGVFYEHAVHRILGHLVDLLDPVRMTVSIRYTPRGGITTTVEASHAG